MTRKEPFLFDLQRVEPPGDFDAFWSAYPRKVCRYAAERAFARACKVKGVTPALLIDAVDRFAAEAKRKGTAPDYLPHGATWLNQRRWEDYPPENEQAPAAPQQGETVQRHRPMHSHDATRPAGARRLRSIDHG